MANFTVTLYWLLCQYFLTRKQLLLPLALQSLSVEYFECSDLMWLIFKTGWSNKITEESLNYFFLLIVREGKLKCFFLPVLRRHEVNRLHWNLNSVGWFHFFFHSLTTRTPSNNSRSYTVENEYKISYTEFWWRLRHLELLCNTIFQYQSDVIWR